MSWQRTYRKWPTTYRTALGPVLGVARVATLSHPPVRRVRLVPASLRLFRSKYFEERSIARLLNLTRCMRTEEFSAGSRIWAVRPFRTFRLEMARSERATCCRRKAVFRRPPETRGPH